MFLHQVCLHGDDDGQPVSSSLSVGMFMSQLAGHMIITDSREGGSGWGEVQGSGRRAPAQHLPLLRAPAPPPLLAGYGSPGPAGRPGSFPGLIGPVKRRFTWCRSPGHCFWLRTDPGSASQAENAAKLRCCCCDAVNQPTMFYWMRRSAGTRDTLDGLAAVSKAEILRGIVTEKLTTAAQEILAVVERTVAGYEEEASGFRREIERQRRQLELLLQPQVKLERTGETEAPRRSCFKRSSAEFHLKVGGFKLVSAAETPPDVQVGPLGAERTCHDVVHSSAPASTCGISRLFHNGFQLQEELGETLLSPQVSATPAMFSGSSVDSWIVAVHSSRRRV
ncbi:uncharacterized protein ACBR49_019273 [Aulostomus maculatus]